MPRPDQITAEAHLDLGWVRAPTDPNMNPPDDEQTFLRDLVKTARQKSHSVKWTDRDGSERLTVLGQAEVVRLNTIAHRQGISKAELLRQAAHIPVAKPAPKAAPPANSG
jgi:hypothetical protein